MSPIVQGSLCRVPDAGYARHSRRHPGRRPEAAKERTRGLFCEACPRDYGDLVGAEGLVGRGQRAVIR